eukprot:g6412.t1
MTNNIKTLRQGPLVASGPRFLLFLAFVTTTLQRAGAQISSPVCTAEATACNEDPECSECSTDWIQGSGAEGFTDAFNDCLVHSGYYDPAEPCSLYIGTPCCYDALSANDCLGNSAFVEFWVCFIDDLREAGGLEEECTAASLTCPEGSGSEVVPDDTDDEADDDASVIGDDAPASDDSAGAVVGDDAAGDDTGPTTVADDDMPAVDDDGAGDDAGAAVGGTTSSQSAVGEEGDSSGVVASFSPSFMLTAFLGLPFAMTASFLAVSL